MATVNWSDLEPDQQAALLASPSLVRAAGAELVAFDLTFIDDITTDLVAAGSSVQWTGAATVHRGCTVGLSRQLDWGNSLLRVYRTYTDGTGLSVRVNRGVFVMLAPDQPLGASPALFQVTGQDRLYLLNRQVGYSYVVASGTNVLTALRQVFTDAGLAGVLVDSTASASTLPQAMTWPLIPVTADSAATPVAPPPDSGTADSGVSGPATWQQIVNDLCALINYRPVWCDDNGLYRCGPYVTPAARPSVFTFDADDTLKSVVGVNRTATGNYYAGDTPNKYIFLWSNPSDVSDGAGGTTPATPVEGNGIYTRTVDTGPTAPSARNGLVWPTQVQLTAASQANLVAQGEARVAADLQLTQSLQITTVPWPAGHYDVFTVTDSQLGDVPWLVEAQTWTEHLDGADTELQLSRVA